VTEADTRRALRLSLAGLSLAYLWKLEFWYFAVIVYRRYPLHDTYFPALLQQFWLFAVAFASPLAYAAYASIRGGVKRLSRAHGVFALASAVLLVHQQSFNDATFVTCLWVSLWALWLASAAARGGSTLSLRAALLAQLIVALFFFGGAVGKTTPAYWSGDVFYGIYFQKPEQHFTFAFLRSVLDDAGMREVARHYSRMVVLSEWGLAALPLLPARLALWLAIAALSIMVVLNNFLLMSVTAPLLAMCWVAKSVQVAAPRET